MNLSGNTYVKVFRSLLEWEWYKDTNTTRVFLHLLLTVSIKDFRFMGADVTRGSRVISYPGLADEIGLSVQSIRTALKHLKSTGEVTVTSYPKFSVATVKNFDKFQEVTGSLTGNQQAANSQSTGNQQAANNIIRRKKNNKEYEEGKEVVTSDTLARMASDIGLSAVLTDKLGEWLDYKTERGDEYKEQGLKALVRKVANKASEYGDQALCELIDECMASNWKGIIFDRLAQLSDPAKPQSGSKPLPATGKPSYSIDEHEQFVKRHRPVIPKEE